MKLRPVRGTHDIYGDEILKFNKIKKIVSDFAINNNFSEIITPIFEFSDLFKKPLGEQSDVVLKEMYTFEDRNRDLLTLRPEYTTPMIRAAISNNMLSELPLKIFGIGPMFRRERPQRGRYRQFNQINFEVFGTIDHNVDLEIISIGNEILQTLLPNYKIELNINSLGTKENLKNYKKKLSSFFNEKKEKLSEESRKKILSNPLRILDSKFEEDLSISKNAPSIIESLSNESKDHYNKLKKSLDYMGIKYLENNQLVRGLDYYCNTVFEFKTSELGSQNTLLGGGRYDGLIKTLGGPDIPGIGWAAGIERIIMLMKQQKKYSNSIHIAISDIKFNNHLLKIIKHLKKNNISYYWNYKYNLKKSLSKANQLKSKYIIIIRESEFNSDSFIIKNLQTSEQNNLNINQIIKYLNDKS